MYDRSILASWRGNSGISIRHHASSELPLQQTETVARRVRCTPRFLQCTWQWRLRRQPARIPNRAASSPRWALRQSLWRMAYRRSRFHRDEHRAIIVGQKCTVTFLIGEHIGVPKAFASGLRVRWSGDRFLLRVLRPKVIAPSQVVLTPGSSNCFAMRFQ